LGERKELVVGKRWMGRGIYIKIGGEGGRIWGLSEGGNRGIAGGWGEEPLVKTGEEGGRGGEGKNVGWGGRGGEGVGGSREGWLKSGVRVFYDEGGVVSWRGLGWEWVSVVRAS